MTGNYVVLSDQTLCLPLSQLIHFLTLIWGYCSQLFYLPLSLISCTAIKKSTLIHPHPPHTLTQYCTPFLGVGIMNCVPVHPYFKVISLVSLYILSVKATWRTWLMFKYVYIADLVVGFSLYCCWLWQDKASNNFLFQFSSSYNTQGCILTGLHLAIDVWTLIQTHLHTQGTGPML